MATPIIMPKFGMTQTEATVVRWLVDEGQAVQAGDPLLEVETDKVNMEVEAPAGGELRGIAVHAGQVAPVTAVIAYIVQPGEALPAAATRSEPRRATAVAARVAAEAGIDVADVPADGQRVTRSDVQAYLARTAATPAARRLAREHGADLSRLAGSGPQGRIQAADVAATVEAPGVAHGAPAVAPGQTIPLQGMRRTIARRMTESYQSTPHIALTVEVNMAAAESLRAAFNARLEQEQGARVSVTAILVRVCAWALRRHPLVNAALHGETIHLHEQANIGVAVALDEGLIVPVLHGAASMGIAEISRRLDDLSERARQGTLAPDDVRGGTFTISNLGMFGVTHFTAIINPPQAAILAVGRIVKRAVVDERSDAVCVRPVMEMTLSADHRVLDGAAAARFLADLAAALEQPGLLLW